MSDDNTRMPATVPIISAYATRSSISFSMVTTLDIRENN
jgi:hypothetical protein